MRVKPWIVVLGAALAVSLSLNAWLGYAMLNDAIGDSYAAQVHRETQRERHELIELRTEFCPSSPSRELVERWARQRGAEPYEKDGFVWFAGVGARFDANQELVGVCLPSTWQSIEGAWNEEFSACPPEPLC